MTAEKYEDDVFDFIEVSPIVMAGERLIFNVTEDILLAMQDSGISQSELARKMGKSRSYVSNLLDGTRNMTLKTLSDINFILGTDLKVCILKNGMDVSLPIVPPLDSRRFSVKSNLEHTENKISIKITMPSMSVPA